jgi:site-specific DNA-cytosine methylase
MSENISNHKYASIVPLIGGETIAMQNIFKKKPEYLLSYEPFKANDSHLVEYYQRKVPYHLLGDNGMDNLPSVDVVNTVCPCAGLSSLSTTASSNSSANDWMPTTARYVLGTLSPRVFWGENAPRLASEMGRPVVENLRKIGKEFGYTFSIFKTKSILHGLSQVRDRTFYFFWKSDKVPVFEYINKEHEKIEDVIRSNKRDQNDPMNVLTNQKIPSEDPYYRYVLEELEGNITHSQFQDKIVKSVDVLHYIEDHVTYDKVADWMDKNGYEKQATRCRTMYSKLKAGGNVMRRGVNVPKNYIGAFVGAYPTSLTHPDEDRYLTIRECLSIMKLPEDFNLVGGLKNLNHICQNVPVTTAQDMAEHVMKFLDGRLDNQMVDTDYLVQDNKNMTLNYKKESLQLDAFMV